MNPKQTITKQEYLAMIRQASRLMRQVCREVPGQGWYWSGRVYSEPRKKTGYRSKFYGLYNSNWTWAQAYRPYLDHLNKLFPMLLFRVRIGQLNSRYRYCYIEAIPHPKVRRISETKNS